MKSIPWKRKQWSESVEREDDSQDRPPSHPLEKIANQIKFSSQMLARLIKYNYLCDSK